MSQASLGADITALIVLVKKEKNGISTGNILSVISQAQTALQLAVGDSTQQFTQQQQQQAASI